MRLKIGARRSDLARLQAYMVGERIEEAHPEIKVEYHFKESLGDINLTDPLWKAPEKGLFTEDFYEDLAQGRADLVVHSWKDLPIVDKPLTRIAATLPRADARDVLLFKKSSHGKSQLTILSSSPRRNYNLTPFFAWSLPWKTELISMESVRGNIPTRVRKLMESPADGIIVAKAALDRLSESTREEFSEVKNLLKSFLGQLDFQVIPHSVNPPCAGQGALAIEIRRGNIALEKVLESVNCTPTFKAVEEERRILKKFGGGCHQKIGVWIHQRPYGKIQILKGLTEQGEILDHASLTPTVPPPRYSQNDLIAMAEDSEPARVDLQLSEPQDTSSWIVARTEALPTSWKHRNRFIWSAGTKTWRKLAEKGVWVHGSFDGLGEEEIRLPFLAQAPTWLKLTHTRARARNYPQLATYEVTHKSPPALKDTAFFYWRSSDHFEQFFAKFPELAKACHACGPGATYHSLIERLGPMRVYAFLNESDWRRQCQI